MKYKELYESARLECGHLRAENTRLQKAFALACQTLKCFADCPSIAADLRCPKRIGEESCNLKESAECWEQYLLDHAAAEAVLQEKGT